VDAETGEMISRKYEEGGSMSRQIDDAAVANEHSPTYMDVLLRGEILMQDIDDFIDAWHDAPEGSVASSMSLAEYLGMTEDEYQLWVEHPSSLRFIAATHRAKQPVGALLASRDQLGLAVLPAAVRAHNLRLEY
jgi:hypothetical protein